MIGFLFCYANNIILHIHAFTYNFSTLFWIYFYSVSAHISTELLKTHFGKLFLCHRRNPFNLFLESRTYPSVSWIESYTTKLKIKNEGQHLNVNINIETKISVSFSTLYSDFPCLDYYGEVQLHL